MRVKAPIRAVLALSVVGVASALVVGTSAFGGGGKDSLVRDVATGKLKAAQVTTTVTRSGQTRQVTKTLPSISGGTLATAQAAIGFKDEREEAADSGPDPGIVDLGQGKGTLGCAKRDQSDNVRVNQGCEFRRQAEEEIAFNPADPSNLIAGQNDSRVGYNQCGIDWSVDGGRHWGDLLPPFRQRINDPTDGVNTIAGGAGTGHTYDAGSDPTVAFDSQGRGFFSCITFDVNSNASGLYVTASPSGAAGSFFNNVRTPKYMVVEDNSPNVFHDKNFIAADSFAKSPNRDNVYVTWSVFFVDASNPNDVRVRSPIYGSMSTDHAQTWSKPEEISGNSPTLCFNGDLFPGQDPHQCNNNQGSDPVVLPNGDLVVPFNNGNTPLTTPNAQQLAVHCAPSGDSAAGTAKLNCDPPTKVGDDVIAGEPLCDFGRGPEECIPGAFIRTNDFPRSAVSTDSGTVYVAWQDYRNGQYDIQLAASSDGGATWSTSSQVNPDSGIDHYFPAIDVAETGKGDRVGVSYYRTERIPDENTTPAGGFTPGRDPGVQATNSDYVLAGGRAEALPFGFKVVSPVFPPPNDPAQAGFNGDYSGLVVLPGTDHAKPIWSDTRNVNPFVPPDPATGQPINDEDVFTGTFELPEHKGRSAAGVIGKG